jgi:endonuclease YncB( thermonuclease family)
MAKPELNTVIVSYGLSLLSQLPLFLLLTLSTDPASAATVASIGDGDTLRVRVREA